MTEFTAGCMSGLAQNIIGHPLDTLKVMIQNNKKIDNFKNINLLSKKYYKGVLYPTALSILLNGISFQTNHLLKNNHNKKNHFLNGFLTGFITIPSAVLLSNISNPNCSGIVELKLILYFITFS